MIIKFADMAKEREESVMRCERSVIVMTVLRLGYLIQSLGNRAMILFIETSLSRQEGKSTYQEEPWICVHANYSNSINFLLHDPMQWLLQQNNLNQANSSIV